MGSFLKSINVDALITVGIVGGCAFGLVKYAGRLASKHPQLRYMLVEDEDDLGYVLVAVDGHDISTAELVALDRAIDHLCDAPLKEAVAERQSFETEIDNFLEFGGFDRFPESGWFK